MNPEIGFLIIFRASYFTESNVTPHGDFRSKASLVGSLFYLNRKLSNAILLQAKAEADKRAKMMSQLDDEFGVGDIVSDKLKEDSKNK